MIYDIYDDIYDTNIMNMLPMLPASMMAVVVLVYFRHQQLPTAVKAGKRKKTRARGMGY